MQEAVDKQRAEVVNTTGRTGDGVVNHPPHYNAHPSGIECIEVVRHMMHDTGSAVAYIWRADIKNGAEDLKKALWYLRDTVDNGSASHWYPSHIADVKLKVVADLEPDEERRELFDLIRRGSLVTAMRLLETLIGEANG